MTKQAFIEELRVGLHHASVGGASVVAVDPWIRRVPLWQLRVADWLHHR